MIKAPIWKDTYYSKQTEDGVFTYYLATNVGDTLETIFNGKAWAFPNTDTITININRICQDYLSTSLPDLRTITATTSYTQEEAYREFYLYDENDVLKETYRFLLDWSYEDKDFNNNINMSNPINGHYCNGMFSLNTVWNKTNVVTTITPTNGEYCGDYAIYYLNRSGGWDAFLIEGLSKKTDALEKYYINKSFNNTTIEFGKRVYHNQITTSWELHTGWLTDAQSENLAFNLLTSNQSYLHNLSTGEIIPIVVTNEEAEYKTFKNNNKKMVNYTIRVEASQFKQNIGQ